MATLTFNKAKLIDLLKEKRAQALANAKVEQDESRKEAIKDLEQDIKIKQADLDLLKAGKRPKDRYLRAYDDNYYTAGYDDQIKRLELSDNVTITLTDRGTDDLFRLIK